MLLFRKRLIAWQTQLSNISPMRLASTRTDLHHLLGMVILVSHASEIGRVVSHLDWLDLLLASGAFILWQLSEPAKEKEI